jgi:hypothetical protein
MANVMLNKGKEAILARLLTDNVKAAAIDLDDWTRVVAHQNLSDVPGAAIVATSANLGGKTVTDGVFDCADYVLPSVTGDQFEAILYYIDSGVAATSTLLALIDTDSGSVAISLTPDGNNVNVTVNAGGVFALGTPET